MFRIRTIKLQPKNRRNVPALRHARCEGHRRYYDVLPMSACSGKERVASGTVPLSVGRKYRNLRIAQESLDASLTWSVRGRFDAEARSPPTHTTDSQLTRCYVSGPSNSKPTTPPTNKSRQRKRFYVAKPAPPSMENIEKHPPNRPCEQKRWVKPVQLFSSGVVKIHGERTPYRNQAGLVVGLHALTHSPGMNIRAQCALISS